MLHTLSTFLIKPVALLLASVLSFGGYHVPTENISLGAFNPTGGGTYRLQSSVGGSDTTLTLSSFKEPVSNIKYTMSYLNSSIEYATIEPQTSTKEFVSFTGITQNSDGTATLTGLTRGLGFSYPYTASTTLQQSHSGQSIFILSNPPQLTNQYANRNNDDSILGLWNFTQAPIDNGTSTSTLQFATRGYVNSIAIQGAATATPTTSGIGLLATGAQAAAGTYTLTSPYLLSTLISTSTRFGDGNNKAVITKTNDGIQNTIDPNFIATSSNYTWGGINTYSGALVANATSTLASSTITTLIVTNITSAPVMKKIMATTTDSVYLSSQTGTTTMITTTVPGGTLGTNNAVHVKFPVSNFTSSGGNTYTMDVVYGGTTVLTFATTTGASQTVGGTTGVQGQGTVEITLFGSGATNTQEGELLWNLNNAGNVAINKVGTSAINSLNDQTLSITFASNGTGVQMTIPNALVYSIK